MIVNTENGNPCPTCGKRLANQMRMERFEDNIASFIRSNRVAVLDSCILCVEKHVSRAMIYLEEMLTATGSGKNDGTAAVNVPLNHLKILGHLGCAIEESEEFSELNALLVASERSYRYEGIAPDWKKIAEQIEHVKPEE